MEYLMTYGWAILIIAIVLGVLYYLGVFNSATLAPRAQPGSCQVFRPNGAGTSFDIGLEGTCNNELPEYVTGFNGQSSYVSISLVLEPVLDSESVSAWVNPSTVTGRIEIINTRGIYFNVQNSGELCFYQNGASSAYTCSSTTKISTNAWTFVSATYSQPTGAVSLYINGQNVMSNTIGTDPTTNHPDAIGVCSYCSYANYFTGQISNVQVYNATLSASEVQALYQEGIGGAPVKPQNLVGWWPLNGNAQDYSGDLNNGVANSVTYTSSWTSGYTAP